MHALQVELKRRLHLILPISVLVTKLNQITMMSEEGGLTRMVSFLHMLHSLSKIMSVLYDPKLLTDTEERKPRKTFFLYI